VYSNTVQSNQIGSVSTTATGTFYALYVGGSNSTAGSTWNIYGNLISNNTRNQSTMGAGDNNYLYIGGTGKIANIYNNTITQNTSASRGTTNMFYYSSSGSTANIYGNLLTKQVVQGGTINGFNIGAVGTVTLSKNTIEDLLNTGDPVITYYGSFVYGFNFSISSAIATLYNNFIGDLRAPHANSDPPFTQ